VDIAVFQARGFPCSLLVIGPKGIGSSKYRLSRGLRPHVSNAGQGWLGVMDTARGAVATERREPYNHDQGTGCRDGITPAWE